ncbi:flagellin [Pullulanibacillus sp. KACC 23026]|uniref:flagellin n=1 Tax=Pullulanibacillus sp. KACC 23026 TaxID=3028315 RepID=UPI0023AEF0C0|nr:flagellin [Pullulanibacillus sp. KACC 23026]WEG11252.1 flagellin [Pullulanibacillus sp. KACC 23026]
MSMNINGDFVFKKEVSLQLLAINPIDVMTQPDAANAIDQIDEAIETVSSERSRFGALQNRLEYSLNNASNYETNITASESRISAADMASEMMNQSKYSILSQVAEAMLAQANQQSQQVLQLLRG